MEYGSWEVLRTGGDVAILAVGTMVGPSLAAAEGLAKDGIRCTVVNCRFLKPYDTAVFTEMVRSHPLVLTVEEGQVSNGFGAFMSREIDGLDLPNRPRVSALGIPDAWVEHGARNILMQGLGLDAEGIARRVMQLSGRNRTASLESA
jgi:1-deoxy-D-xylulose-5-phosphate synthase